MPTQANPELVRDCVAVQIPHGSNVTLPKGTHLEAIAHFDNSENNPYNPNPNIDVPYGPQTTDEMQVSFMGFITDVKSDPSKLLPRVGGRVLSQLE